MTSTAITRDTSGFLGQLPLPDQYSTDVTSERQVSADCVFCKIAAKEIPSSIVYEDGEVVGFKDQNPRAPLHVLVIPRRHVASLAELDDPALAGALTLAAVKVAKEAGHGENFRLVVNNGPGAGQSVFHIHIHVLAGRVFTWPPG
jgi:histidine triad (HIT) family protein